MYALVPIKKKHLKIFFWKDREYCDVTFDAISGPVKVCIEKKRIQDGFACCRVVSFGSSTVILAPSDNPKDTNWFSMNRDCGLKLNVRRIWA